MSLFVFSTNSIIGISIRMKTLVPQKSSQICRQSNVYPACSTRISCQHCIIQLKCFFFLWKTNCTLPHTGVFNTHCMFCIIPCTPTPTCMPIFTQKFTFVSKEKIKLFADFYTQHHTNSCSDILDANVLQKWKHLSLNKETNSLIWLI